MTKIEFDVISFGGGGGVIERSSHQPIWSWAVEPHPGTRLKGPPSKAPARCLAFNTPIDHIIRQRGNLWKIENPFGRARKITSFQVDWLPIDLKWLSTSANFRSLDRAGYVRNFVHKLN